MSSHDHKKKIEDKIERAFDKAHKFVDTVTYPLGPVDAVIHGTARGVRNWLLDEHPGDRPCNNNNNNNKCPPNPPNPNCSPTPQSTNHNNFSGNTGNNSNNFSGNNAPAGNNSKINIGGGK